jgi:hypothetical protein
VSEFDIPDEAAMLARIRPKKVRAKKAKPPCKYGPRGADGYCPKKPKAPKKAREVRVRDLESVGAAGRQAGEVLRSSKATGEQKREAVGVLGQAVAVESGKKVAEHIAREGRKSLRTAEGRAAAKTLGRGAVSAVKVLAPVAAIAGTLVVGGAVLDANRLRESEKKADAELKRTEKTLGRRLTDKEHETLRQQYIEFFYKQPVVNPYLGK